MLSISSSFPDNTVSEGTIKALRNTIDELARDLKETKESYEKSRFDIITLMGVFVGLITYLGLEIQVFKVLSNPLLIIGVSIFFIASILLFILTMDMILKGFSVKTESKKPLCWIFGILVFLLIVSVGCIGFGVNYRNNTANVVQKNFEKI